MYSYRLSIYVPGIVLSAMGEKKIKAGCVGEGVIIYPGKGNMRR